jgi:hypothetical protein
MPSVDRVYAVAKLQERWVVYVLEDDEMLYEGSFVAAWAFASDLALRTAPARVVALNAAGDVVARAIFNAVEI